VLIPRIFHQIWVGPEPLPDEYAAYGQTWLDHHPGWERRLWSEDNLPEGLRPEVYERLRAPAERANVLRLELLSRQGGVYVDTDFECLRSIEPLIEDAELFITLAKPGRVNNALMGSVPGHPLIAEALDQIRPVEFFGHDKARTGTRLLDGLLIDRPGVTLLDAELFYPETEAERQRAYALHRKTRSWKDPDELRIDLERAERKIVALQDQAAKRKLRHQRAEAELDRIRRSWPRRVQRAAGRAVGRGYPRTICLFIGYPRSGHSLVGSLLDAHPDVVIAHEVNVLKLVAEEGLGRRELIETLLESSEAEAMRPMGRRASGYSYAVPGQWQGSVRQLRVLGAKAGEKTTIRLGRNPDELALLRRRIGAPARLVHIARNPYDMVARMAMITKDGEPERSVAGSIDFVGRLARINAKLIEAKNDVLTVRHESFVHDPRGELRRIASFLRVEPDESWVEACAALVFESPRRTRDRMPWTDEERDAVQAVIDRYDFFQGYGWDE
jgi:hypothetical protein